MGYVIKKFHYLKSAFFNVSTNHSISKFPPWWFLFNDGIRSCLVKLSRTLGSSRNLKSLKRFFRVKSSDVTQMQLSCLPVSFQIFGFTQFIFFRFTSKTNKRFSKMRQEVHDRRRQSDLNIIKRRNYFIENRILEFPIIIDEFKTIWRNNSS